MKRMCSICARGGSKGVPGKNERLIAGKALLEYSVDQARDSGLFAVIAVSSDSDSILQLAQKLRVDFAIKRPAELATDTAAKLPVIKHCAQKTEELSGQRFETFVDLDCTSPLRSVQDILDVVELLEKGGAPNVITAMPSRRSPYFNLIEKTPEGRIQVAKQMTPPYVRRQDAPLTYDMNASIYAWTRAGLFENEQVFLPATALFVMPEERSIDIDSPFDFEIVEYLLNKKSI